MLLYPTVEVLSKICSFRNCKKNSLLCRDLGKKLSLFPVLCCADMKNLFKNGDKPESKGCFVGLLGMGGGGASQRLRSCPVFTGLGISAGLLQYTPHPTLTYPSPTLHW